MSRAKQTKSIDKFNGAISYLTEYAGVRGAVIADREGLVLASGGADGFDPERYAAYAPEIIDALKGPLGGVTEPVIEWLGIKTADCWLTIAALPPVVLVVAADRRAADLLHIRVTRSLDMIAAQLREKYGLISPAEKQKANQVKSLEAIHV